MARMLEPSRRRGRIAAVTAAVAALSGIGLTVPASAAAPGADLASCRLEAGRPYVQNGKVYGHATANTCGGKWDRATIFLLAGNPAPGGVRWAVQDSNPSGRLSQYDMTWTTAAKCVKPIIWRTQVLAYKGKHFVKEVNQTLSVTRC
ncbi:hypothetical protein [Streptomyces sp. I05A-00742]|uniref:hypothetical protein n=1 Tax=Streptomyces sp. I05A-00742 TaxID=2732853 RepID=UPI0014877968|nr:hypothetical protein [Streptomyces sp. I05A-00742]